MSATTTIPAAAAPKTVEQLQAELAEAERIVVRIREDLERAQWLRDYEETPA